MSLMASAVLMTFYRKITECRLLEVDYELAVTWEVETNKLRCNADFHHHAQYDTVIFRDTEFAFTFARLVCTFVCQTDGHCLPMALVQPLDVGIGGHSRTVDVDFDLCRFKM